VNIKGKTHERVDAVGEERAIEVHVVALLVPLT
jgi:2C-methyl-D-erythritol 2,4-cyclodiphosphate synthase